MNVLVVDIGGTAVKILATGQVEPRIAAEPHNLAPRWIRFDFEAAFGCPVKLLNDAAMQALGSYDGGTLLFLGLGTGLGSALVAEGHVIPMELGHLPYENQTVEDYLGDRGLKQLGRKEWQRPVEVVVARLIDALHPDDVVLGGGNSRHMKSLPQCCRAGSNSNAFLGGFRLWTEAGRPRNMAGGTRHQRLT
jgi:polyphosphate glucokinase